MGRKPINYPTNFTMDCTDAKWLFCALFLCFLTENILQRHHWLRGMFDALRLLAKTVCPWWYKPSDFPPFIIVFQQAESWGRSGSTSSFPSRPRPNLSDFQKNPLGRLILI